MPSGFDKNNFETRVHQNDRSPVDEFDLDELLYRRVNPVHHLIEGVLSPLAFNFPNQSFNRGRYSLPEDVLHPDCCSGMIFKDWRVATLSVSDIPNQLRSGDDKEFRFSMHHTPERLCYPHSEIRCRQGVTFLNDRKPPKKVREEFRAILAQKARIV